ncbi:MAG: hypothetical protein R3E86_00555 [Pseudomonadales bacterium]
MTKTRVLALLGICLALGTACSKAGTGDTSVEATFSEVCTTIAGADAYELATCKVIPETIDRFVTDPDQRRGAYALSTARTLYQSHPGSRGELWRLLVDRFGVDESLFDRKTHGIARGQLNEVIEAMYQGAGIDYGGDRRAFQKAIETQLTSPAAQAFIEERSKLYMQTGTG